MERVLRRAAAGGGGRAAAAACLLEEDVEAALVDHVEVVAVLALPCA